MKGIGQVILALIAIVLFGIGVLAGGCSILFTPALFQGGEFGGSGIFPVWLTGLLVGGGGIAIAIVIFRNLGPKQPSVKETLEEMQQDDGAAEPKGPDDKPE